MGKFRHGYGAVLACAALAVIGCGSKHEGGGGPDGGSGGTISSIVIAPPTANVALTGAGPTYSATQAYTVTATYADGSTADVTSIASWDADDENAVMFSGTPTATVTVAGNYQIFANVGGVNATAALTATLQGSSMGSGFAPSAQALLDATPDPTIIPTIAYPLAGSLFPVNIAPIEIHTQATDATQSIARITFTVDQLLTYSFYANCTPSPNPGTFAKACIVSVSGDFANQLAGVSETADVQLTVRLAAADGTKLGESAPIALDWAKTPLTGGLYYWTTAGAKENPTFATAIARYDFAGDTSAPQMYIKDTQIPTVPNGSQCLGCHAVSPDGSALAFSTGGSTGGYLDLYAAASPEAPLANSGSGSGFANMIAFSPDGTRMVNMAYGVLTLRDASASLTTDTANLLSTAVPGEKLSHPTWSSSGQKFAFTSWIPNSYDVGKGSDTGDMVQGGEIWITSADGTTPTGTPTLLVPRAFTPPASPTSPATNIGTGVTNYYPNISDDDQFVVFNQSHCDGPSNLPVGTWGQGPCDGYNDISATLWVVPTAGGTPVALTNANGPNFTGKGYPEVTNSWPRWSPDHGTFRGKTLYWVAFSSRRQYGLSLASGAGVDTTKPQLWFAAVAIDGNAAPTTDPSFAPVWLPGQDPDLTAPRGNHTPAWTSRAVQIQ